MEKINQKEYLKKYLSSDSKLKKKKKKSKESIIKATVKIIDDDDYNKDEIEIDESELFALNEEAPQICGIIDDRPPELLVLDYRKNNKWKSLADSSQDSSSNLIKGKVRRRSSSDESPPRKCRNNSPHNSQDSDASPPRRGNGDFSDENRRLDKYSHKEYSKPRSKYSRWSRSRSKEDGRHQRNSRRNSDNSPPRKTNSQSKNSPGPPKMSKTLEGKSAGLQDARTLRKENDAFKEKQDKMYKDLRPEMSGRNAENLVMRERRARPRNEIAREIEEDKRKIEAEQERKMVYDRWGKGLKQVEDYETHLKEAVHEMNKPLARAADDGDLQDYLKNQERLDDPMLEYMRNKRRDSSRKAGAVEKPQYQGTAPENRFGIRPGYRWDGVNRSNGYEQKYFDKISSKKAIEIEAYRYSTEDM